MTKKKDWDFHYVAMQFSKLIPSMKYGDAEVFQKLQRERWVGYYFGAACLVFAIFAMLSQSSNLKERGSVFVSHTDGTIEFGRLNELDPKAIMFTQLAEIATEVIFARNPNGLLKEHWLDLFFVGNAKKQLQDDVKAKSQEFKAKNTHQHPEIRQIRYMRSTDGILAFRVDGQLIRRSSFSGTELPEPAMEFRLGLGFQRNTDMLTNKQWPYRVVIWREETQARDSANQ